MAEALVSAFDVAPYLHAYLTAQRWFRSSDHRATGLDLRALAELSPSVFLALVHAQLGERTVLYQLPLTLCANGSVTPHAVVMPQPGNRVLADALHHPESRALVCAALLTPGRWETPWGIWSSDPLPGAPPCSRGVSHVLRGEQSNSTVVYAESAVLKLYRRLEAGINPDPEIVGFLSQSGFSHVPQLHSTLTFMDTHGSRHDAAMLQGFIPQATDGWNYFLQLVPLEWPANSAMPGVAEATELGRMTRAMHDALAAPELPTFAPLRAGALQVDEWLTGTATEAKQAWSQLAEQQSRLPGALRVLANQVLTQRGAIGQLIAAARGSLRNGAGQALRLHGDYHLGQILRTQDQRFMVLDFEGEPLRPMEARRQRHSPLRDVASMLRSFAYAGATAAQRAPQAAATAHAWEAQVSDAFLAGYLQPPTPTYLPAADGIRPLLKLFIVEKALYELRYEINHRPTWVGIPLQALQRLLGDAEGRA